MRHDREQATGNKHLDAVTWDNYSYILFSHIAVSESSGNLLLIERKIRKRKYITTLAHELVDELLMWSGLVLI